MMNIEEHEYLQEDAQTDLYFGHLHVEAVAVPLPHPISALSVTPRPKPRSRSRSMKKPNKHHLDDLQLEEMRPRTCSLPNKNGYQRPQFLSPPISAHFENQDDSDWYRLRNFVTTSKGIINRGDSYKSRSSNSIVSSGSSISEVHQLSRASSFMSQGSTNNSVASSVCAPPYRVLVVGSQAVGKTAITQQFMTSEYMGDIDDTFDEESDIGRSVSVLLDGEESAMDFVDVSSDELQDSYSNVDAYMVVFAINDRTSFARAVDMLYRVRKREKDQCAIILVANKGDLVRSRHITSEEAKSVARTYDCKYIETSTTINHNVDELLCGILSQIRLKQKNLSKSNVCDNERGHSQLKGPKQLLCRFFKKDISLSKSCEDLYGP